MIALRPRLKILYERACILLGEGAGFHDIACDHAKLAAAISLARPDVRIEASDILKTAIDRARAIIHLSETELYVSDGFSRHSLEEGDVIVIAGVGGHTIIDLLEAAKMQVPMPSPRLQLLLQTSQQVDILRENLYGREDVTVVDEFLVQDRGLTYVNFQVELRLPWQRVTDAEGDLYKYYGGGPRLVEDKETDGLLEEYLQDCLHFADMKIHAVTQSQERANWQVQHKRVLEILKRGR